MGKIIHIPDELYHQLARAASVEQKSVDDEAAARLIRSLHTRDVNPDLMERIHARREHMGGYIDDEWIEHAINSGRE